jgi:hypothetical protein
MAPARSSATSRPCVDQSNGRSELERALGTVTPDRELERPRHVNAREQVWDPVLGERRAIDRDHLVPCDGAGLRRRCCRRDRQDDEAVQIVAERD